MNQSLDSIPRWIKYTLPSSTSVTRIYVEEQLRDGLEQFSRENGQEHSGCLIGNLQGDQFYAADTVMVKSNLYSSRESKEQLRRANQEFIGSLQKWVYLESMQCSLGEIYPQHEDTVTALLTQYPQLKLLPYHTHPKVTPMKLHAVNSGSVDEVTVGSFIAELENYLQSGIYDFLSNPTIDEVLTYELSKVLSDADKKAFTGAYTLLVTPALAGLRGTSWLHGFKINNEHDVVTIPVSTFHQQDIPAVVSEPLIAYKKGIEERNNAMSAELDELIASLNGRDLSGLMERAMDGEEFDLDYDFYGNLLRLLRKEVEKT